MIRNSEASERAAALPAHSIERDDGLFQIGVCDDAAGGIFHDPRNASYGRSPHRGSGR